MSTSRKIFIGRVTIPALTATSLLSLMQNSALHWGLESDLTTPSLDSIIGSNVSVKPDGPVLVGSDGTTALASTGIVLAAGATFSLQDFGSDFGIIDPNVIYFWSVSGSGMAVTLTAR